MSMRDEMFNSLKMYFPHIARRAVEWKEDGFGDLFIRIDDGSCWLYNDFENTLGKLPSDSNRLTEQECRKEFGRRLRRLMWRNGISQAELSDKTGISVPVLSNYITGKNTPSFYKVDKIAKAIGCSVDELRYI